MGIRNLDSDEMESSSESGRPEGMGGLASKASTGAAWTIVGHGGEQVVRLASNLIVTRLLLAEYFGLMALVSVFLIGLQLFSDIGIGPALVQNKREDAGFVNTVWTIQVFRGLALCAIAFPVAPLFADFYDEPILTPLIRVSALTAAIRGFTSTSFYTQTRHLQLKGPVIVQFASQLAGTIVMVAWAWTTRSVWSLVTSGIVAALVMVVLSHVWLPGIRNRFHFERRAARSLFVFGSWIFLSTVATFGANQVDRLIFGKLTTMTMLGVYSIAVMLALAPTQALSTVSNRVLFPLYTRVHHSPEDLPSMFRTARWPLIVLGGWAIAGLIGGGPTIIQLLYDSRYWEAGWMLQILAAGLWFGIVLGGTYGAVVLAVGRSDWTASMSFSKVFGMVAFIPLGYWLGGFPGAVGGLAMSEFVRYCIAVYGAAGLGFDERRKDLAVTIRVAISALAGWSAVAWLTELGITHVVIHAFIVFVVVTAFWTPPFIMLIARVRREKSLFGHAGTLSKESRV
ncbi:MAG: oligosaccharide flippase family protein [Myxococcales bacterium]|nr:oligosaccharide flippase family protein [Myxococcales bacterium]